MATADEAGEATIAPASVLQMLAGMRATGLDVDEMCRRAGVSQADLGTQTTYVPIRDLMSLWRMAIQQSGRATIGLHVGAAMPTGTLMDYLAFSSATLRDGLGQITRYYGLIGRHARWVLGARRDDGSTLFEHQLHPAGGTPPPHVREFSVTLIVCRIRRWFDTTPVEVWLKHAPLGPADEYQQVLGCPVRFEQDRMGLLFKEAALELPSRHGDPALARLLESHATRLLAEAPRDTTFQHRVREVIVARLKGGEPDIRAIARALAMSDRSLQRRLQAEGVSFRDVLDDARRGLAELYLHDPTLSLTDVACLLGYSEAATFTRAFKRWTGKPPSAVRG